MTSFNRFVEELERDPEMKERIDAERRRLRDDLDPPCAGCGAPRGFPPAGPCDNHGTASATPATETSERVPRDRWLPFTDAEVCELLCSCRTADEYNDRELARCLLVELAAEMVRRAAR